jgi:hypothetical protein
MYFFILSQESNPAFTVVREEHLMFSIDFLYVSVCVGHYQTASDSTMRIVSVANITYAKDRLSCAYKNVKMYQLLVV